MKVEFSDHALQRTGERCPQMGLKAIACEIDDAIAEGRISREPPNWRMANVRGQHQDVEFAWSSDQRRVYVLARRRREFVVLVSIVHGIRAAA